MNAAGDAPVPGRMPMKVPMTAERRVTHFLANHYRSEGKRILWHWIIT